MKKYLLCILFIIINFSCKALNINNLQSQVNIDTLSFTPDTITNFRNPAMGWVMYDEGWSFENKRIKNNIYTPQVFWQQMESANAPKYSNILYIRILWRDLEPTEGKYAWKYNEEYKWYINKAKQYGLKLAFRVFFHGGVPNYVYAAGAGHTGVDSEGKIQPYYDDPIFLNKFKTFIQAFAKEYDNPNIVDFVDAYGLGRWGEGHGITLKDSKNFVKVMKSVTKMYADNFKKVLTVINLSSNDYIYMKPMVFDKLGFLPRRDGIGSFWFNDTDRKYLNGLFPQKAIIGEGCYWFNSPSGDNSQYTAYKNDKRFIMNNFNDVFTIALNDALANHCNTFDLRVPLECKYWIEKLPNLVQKFISEGGYRLYPNHIIINNTGKVLDITHSWKNYGVGVLPNNHPNWNKKYQVSFALINEKGKPVYLFKNNNINPGNWIKGKSYTYRSLYNLPKNLKGNYILCVGLTDKTENNKAAIDIAVDKSFKIGKWVKLQDLHF